MMKDYAKKNAENQNPILCIFDYLYDFIVDSFTHRCRNQSAASPLNHLRCEGNRSPD